MNFIFDSPQGVYQLAAEHDAKNQVLVNNFGDTDDYSGVNTGAECATKSKYEIVASVLHLGGSIHMGHYVCYAKKRWEMGLL
jgi:uncharacterized UBP type Zn finger protein